MYAILKTGGKQHKVCTGDVIKIEKIEGTVGNDITFDEVLMVVDDDNKIDVGRPVLADAKVTAEIVKQSKDDKIIVFKMKRRKGYRTKNGHRQLITEVKIKDIQTQ